MIPGLTADALGPSIVSLNTNKSSSSSSSSSTTPPPPQSVAVYSGHPFNPASCSRCLLHYGQALLRDNEVLLTSSLSWPTDIAPAEAENDTHWQMLWLAVDRTRTVSKQNDLDFAGLYARDRDVLLSRADEEEAPAGYCDNLFDYWPDVQHPVGYHPSTACSADATHTRGFDTWMLRDEAGNDMIDPVRMRNMPLVSQVFGAAHLVCDAHAYAAPCHRLNPFYMQSRWDAKAHADPDVPTEAEQKTVGRISECRISIQSTSVPLGFIGCSIKIVSINLILLLERTFSSSEVCC